MSIAWLSSDLGASKCYRDDKPRRSDTTVISSDPGPLPHLRVLSRYDRSPEDNELFIINSPRARFVAAVTSSVGSRHERKSRSRATFQHPREQ